MVKETVYVAWNACVVPHEQKLRTKNTLYKIGKTKFDNADARLMQQDWTFIPMAHEILWSIQGRKGLEKRVHKALDSLGWRYSFQGGGMEHFCIPNDFDMQKFLNQFINGSCKFTKWPPVEGGHWNPRK